MPYRDLVPYLKLMSRHVAQEQLQMFTAMRLAQGEKRHIMPVLRDLKNQANPPESQPPPTKEQWMASMAMLGISNG